MIFNIYPLSQKTKKRKVKKSVGTWNIQDQSGRVDCRIGWANLPWSVEDWKISSYFFQINHTCLWLRSTWFEIFNLCICDFTIKIWFTKYWCIPYIIKYSSLGFYFYGVDKIFGTLTEAQYYIWSQWSFTEVWQLSRLLRCGSVHFAK